MFYKFYKLKILNNCCMDQKFKMARTVGQSITHLILCVSNERVWVMVFYTTFDNISVICSDSSVISVGNRKPRENNQHPTSHWQFLSHNVVLSTLRKEKLLRIFSKKGYGCKWTWETIQLYSFFAVMNEWNCYFTKF